MRARISATWPRMPTRDVFLLNLFQCPGRRTLLIATTPCWAPGRRTLRSTTLRLPVTYSCIICYGFHTSHNSTDISTPPPLPLPRTNSPPRSPAFDPAESRAINAALRLSSRSLQLLIRRAFIERRNGVGINQVSPVAVNLSKGRQFSFASELLIARRPLTKRNSQQD